ARIVDLRLDCRHTDNLVIQHHGQTVADVVSRVIAEALAAFSRQREAGLPFPELILTRARIAHLAARDDRALADEIPLLTFRSTARNHLYRLSSQRHYAAVLREKRIAAGKRTVLYIGDLEHGRGSDKSLHSGGVVYARKLDQDFIVR